MAGGNGNTTNRKGIAMRRAFEIVCVAAVVAALGSAAVAVDIVTVPVGDVGNSADSTGYGAVGHVYNIGKYEVTNSQYCEFLNAVADADPNGLYNTDMGGGWNDIGGISRSGSDGNYTYAVRTNRGNRPVNYVSWYDTLRFTNWLHNGQPTGLQDSSTTEDGAYDMSLGSNVVRKSGARVFLPTEDEWYKAAYYKSGGTNAGYWEYPTQSDIAPTAEAPAGTDLTNGSANYRQLYFPYYTNEVGAYSAKPSDSAYGTFDQGGNVWEWTEASNGSNRWLRGGSFFCRDSPQGLNLRASTRYLSLDPSDEYYNDGFRVVRAVPAPPKVTTVIRDPDPVQTERPVSGQMRVYEGGQFVEGGDIDLTKPTVVLTHGWGKGGPKGAFGDAEENRIASRLAAALDNTANIIAWDWSANSGDSGDPLSFRGAAWNTLSEGGALGEALIETLTVGKTEGYGQPVHFIGSSLGTLVNAGAANTIHGEDGQTWFDPDKTHVTLLDDAQGPTELFARLSISPIPEESAWVDNYIALTGRLHAGAANVILTEAEDEGLAFHFYSKDWYGLSIENPDAAAMGYRWSFEAGASGDARPPTGLDGEKVFLQTLNRSDNELVLESIIEEEAVEIIDGRLSRAVIDEGVWATKREVLDLVEAGKRGIQAVGEVSAEVVEVLTQTHDVAWALRLNLRENSPSFAWIPVAIPDDAEMMSFEFLFNGVGDDDFLTAGIDDDLLFAVEGEYIIAGERMNSGLLDISAYTGQEAELFFGFNSDGVAGGTMTIEGIEFHTAATTLTWDGAEIDEWTSAHWNDGLVSPSDREVMVVDAGSVVVSSDLTAIPALSLAVALHAPGGTVNIGSAGRLTVVDNVTVGVGGTLSIDGVLVAAEVNITGGTLTNSSGGVGPITVDGDVTLASGATLMVEATGAGIDTLACTGSVTIDPSASLDITLAAFPGPALGDTMQLISADGGLNGIFGSMNGVLHAANQAFAVTYQPNGATVTVVRPGDFEVDGDVDFADFTYLAANYGQSGKSWVDGDADGNGKVEFTDFTYLAANYGSDTDSSTESPSAGTVELHVDVATGEMWLVGNAAALSGYNITSAANSLLPDADGLASPFQFYLANETDDISAASLGAGVLIEGELALDAAYDTAGPMDLGFSYGIFGQGGSVSGDVIVVPEPACLALLALGGLAALRRRRHKQLN